MDNNLKNTTKIKTNNNEKKFCLKNFLTKILNVCFREPLFNEWLIFSVNKDVTKYQKSASIIERFSFAMILVVALDSIYNYLHKININNKISISIVILLLISTYQLYKAFTEELNQKKYLLIKEIYYNINNILLVSSVILVSPLKSALFSKETNAKTLLLGILLVIIFVAGLRLMDFLFYCAFKLFKKIENNISNKKWFNIRKKRKLK